jgi:hypothetical protein
VTPEPSSDRIERRLTTLFPSTALSVGENERNYAQIVRGCLGLPLRRCAADEDVPDVLGVDISIFAESDIDLLVEGVDEEVKHLLFDDSALHVQRYHPFEPSEPSE